MIPQNDRLDVAPSVLQIYCHLIQFIIIIVAVFLRDSLEKFPFLIICLFKRLLENEDGTE